MKNYKDNISDILNRYDCGTISEYGLLFNVAWQKIHSGDKAVAKQGKAIKAKTEGIMKDYADGLVVSLLTKAHNHVNGSIVDNVQSYLSGEFTAYQFVNQCIDTWLASPYTTDQAFAHGRQIDLSAKFAQLADLVYVSAANALVEVTQ